jgi:transcriptional regulator with XRE-family HTH domain
VVPEGGGNLRPRFHVLNDGPEVADLGRLVREKRLRDTQSVRQAAKDAGVSFSTISRVEGGAQPDLATFLRLCAWLGEPPERFLTPTAVRHTTTVDAVVGHLIGDPSLSAESADAIGRVVRDMYEALATKREPARRPLVLHLRAASALRHGVPERLAPLLADMRSSLEARLASDGH